MNLNIITLSMTKSLSSFLEDTDNESHSFTAVMARLTTYYATFLVFFVIYFIIKYPYYKTSSTFIYKESLQNFPSLAIDFLVLFTILFLAYDYYMEYRESKVNSR